MVINIEKGKVILVYKKYTLIILVLFVFVIPVFTQNVHEAAKIGDIEQLKKLLSEDPSLVKSQDKDKMTPLHHAVESDKLEAASFLIDKGADVNAVNYKTETPLHVAAYAGNAEATKLLLQNGADYTLREMRDRTALYLVCNWGHDLETARLLIDAGSDVNFSNSRGEVLLVSMFFYGRKEIIDLLIDRGAVIPDDEGTLRQVLYLTASNGMERPFNIAVKQCEKKDIQWWAGIPMHACARGGSVVIAEKQKSLFVLCLFW